MKYELAHIDYAFTSCIFDNIPAHVITEIDGNIWLADDNGDSVQAGKVGYYLIDIVLSDDNFDGDTLLDENGDSAAFIGHIYQPGGWHFRKKLLRMMDIEPVTNGLLILRRAEILPAFRGHELMAEALYDGIRFFGKNADLMALRAIPLQSGYGDQGDDEDWIRQMALPEITDDYHAGMEKLIRYYSTLGFRKIPGSEDLMVKAL
ncbi:TPA: hypothetical protein JGU28_004599 [Salmonella enterica]|nr:hypothetical protein [Salmonella enterica]